MKQEKDNERIIIALILAAALMVSAFAISFSIRYKTIGDSLILDQWTKTIYYHDGSKHGILGEMD